MDATRSKPYLFKVGGLGPMQPELNAEGSGFVLFGSRSRVKGLRTLKRMLRTFGGAEFEMQTEQ
jgi:hypothetical protein